MGKGTDGRDEAGICEEESGPWEKLLGVTFCKGGVKEIVFVCSTAGDIFGKDGILYGVELIRAEEVMDNAFRRPNYDRNWRKCMGFGGCSLDLSGGGK
ncbi:hypothetical protein SUGI_0404900 [Cryptomeria japonica]|nr:hypothetical protein SUGI_0404900 [Cryptomeria japonica]